LAPNNASINLENVDWSFNGANTRYLTHGLHRYPARMIPQIPRTLLKYWKETGTLSEGDLIFDPFCGSGTTPTEARLNGFNAVATDINPFACLLARGKTANVDIDEVWDLAFHCTNNEWCTKESFIDYDYDDKDSTELQPGYTANYVKKGWFPKPQLHKIEAMKVFLNELRREYSHTATRIARISLAETARKISYNRDGEFKRNRIPKEEQPDHNPPFTNTFVENFFENIHRVEEFLNHVNDNTTAEIIHGDCRNKNLVAENSVDAICTSPPYGDHATTVGYGQFCQDPASISTSIKASDMKNVDPSGLGGRRSESPIKMEQVMRWSPTLKKAVEAIQDKENGRDQDVLDFFTDYSETLLTMARVIKPGQPIAITVGNRTVSRIPIALNLITTELALEFGLEHTASLPREIPSKTLPYTNAPENVAGQTGNMIANENILIFKGT